MGAGLARLQAALDLEAAGARVQLFEAGTRVGGRLMTIERGACASKSGSRDRRGLPPGARLGRALRPLARAASAPGDGRAARPLGSTTARLCLARNRGFERQSPRASAAATAPRPRARKRREPTSGGRLARSEACGVGSAPRRALDRARHPRLRALVVGSGRQLQQPAPSLDPRCAAARAAAPGDRSRGPQARGRERPSARGDGGGAARAGALRPPLARGAAGERPRGADFRSRRKGAGQAGGAKRCRPPPWQAFVFAPLPAPLAEAIAWREMTAITTVHFRPLEAFWEKDGLPPSMWVEGPLERVFAVAGEGPGGIERLIVWINGEAARRADRLERGGHRPLGRTRARAPAPRLARRLASARGSQLGSRSLLWRCLRRDPRRRLRGGGRGGEPRPMASSISPASTPSLCTSAWRPRSPRVNVRPRKFSRRCDSAEGRVAAGWRGLTRFVTVSEKDRQRNDRQCVDVCRLEDHRRRYPGVIRLQPAGRA